MDAQYIGPYVITRHLGKGLYALRLVDNPAVAVERVNGAHLKPYKTPNHADDEDSSDAALPSTNQSHGLVDDRDTSDHASLATHHSHGPIHDQDPLDCAPPSTHQSHGTVNNQDSDSLDETVPSLPPPMPPLELLNEMTRPSPLPTPTPESNLSVSVADTGFVQQEDSLSESLCQVCVLHMVYSCVAHMNCSLVHSLYLSTRLLKPKYEAGMKWYY